MTITPEDAIKRAPTPPSPAGSVLSLLLTTIFAGACIAKLVGAVAWPWAAILAPIWLPWACLHVLVASALFLGAWK